MNPSTETVRPPSADDERWRLFEPLARSASPLGGPRYPQDTARRRETPHQRWHRRQIAEILHGSYPASTMVRKTQHVAEPTPSRRAVSPAQLLEWIQLRFDNARLRRENELLRHELDRLSVSAAERLQAAPVEADPPPVLEVHGFRLPAALRDLVATIEESRSLLELEDDWDGEGTRGYVEQTWQRVAAFLVRYATELWETHGVVADNVEVLPSSEGGLAIDWRTGNRELLITVPEDPNHDATYYGDDGKSRHKIKGTLDTSSVDRWLVWWLAE
jgi:hypothetical protein